MSYIEENMESFCGIVRGIAKQFGVNCEVVLHDLSLPYDRTIVAIENGHVTNRKIGDSGTNIGLEVLRGTIEGTDRYNYVNRTSDGRVLRSTSIYLKDKAGKVAGSICINFDVTDLLVAERSVSYLANMGEQDPMEECFTGNVDDLLEYLLAEAVNKIGKPVAQMTKEDKVSAVRYLDSKGAFLIKKSMDSVAAYLEVSKFTLYNYLDEIR